MRKSILDDQFMKKAFGQHAQGVRSITPPDFGEAGVSLIGVIFWLLILVFAIAFVVKVMPSYYDYWSLKNIVSQQAQQSGPEESASQIRHNLNSRLGVAMINIPQKDIQIEKGGTGPALITVSYDKVVPLIANISLLLHFEAVGH
ncbi:DUF4845 domain-containing protein [Acidithiobacillus sp.]|jgi:hypothetical protein|uniref:DUF4845 domain-containing protein n=1 Tax=Acidithiobacillus sp. TaxID=1872118 RepID=UPI0025C12863|nr:DUF4845 domain-containing protein [Acidithiobacillus sp.]MCK9188344.1 DUF4845 domain-containing protein [Acidithiobacillus sp.]MCK9358765.1 DUF4845 domain-containing protein [Acidithiobacillus sp.]